MITEKDNVFYCDCGFSFERGRSGNHECGDGLRRKLESFRTAFLEYSEKTDWMQADKRFDVIKPWGKHRADVLKEYIEHLESKLLAGESGFPPLTVELLMREKEALEKRVVELEARMVKLPERYEVEICPTPSPDGEWYSREDILSALISAGVSYAAAARKGE
ncbi:hypothetical protein M7982_23655 [Enterobacter hormaechei subsp. xiangfangensis]|uniref:hypothetical protein n=1 Tax=Enterobacter hormaechei TaxID=158836 RepID=UPI00223696E6|nr:hypothetical protein [Enterobacter hormaechei]MCW4687923.1 hypothetical protein [Enterobacter hormaechei subsp. xiangfangensis]MCW4789544.1 hypothetical protein [Enterobacter hormaechei subsp. xiangfangensis]MCW4817897.1 hypothetical protein [Enterobacter hormaechei subsp. xiangfangensis]MCW4939253.1 hypothetical protein [Enterobacter hormaechei subsp. xiangfangensis]MCW5036690.1 hypothetical protein [Enterobacter hormaechei subsp. xiangfangensis]